MALTIQQIRAMAPILKLHPNETCWPMDPIEFIKQSRFRHHQGLGADQGYNKRVKQWIDGDKDAPEYYDIPVDFINRYTVWKNDENRRPRDCNRGSHWNVFLEPKGKPSGHPDPTGNVPVFYYQCAVDTSKIPKKERDLFGIKVEQFQRISYWWFMGYNEAPATIDHQGDWEHVTMRFENDKIIGVHFARHEEPVNFLPVDQLRTLGDKVIVFSAKGTHASYPTPGNRKLILGFEDEVVDGGYAWDTSQNLASLLSQPWRDYAGAWGRVGETAATTGPLGPWHKRHKA